MQRIAVLRALQLGDLLVAVPALRALRRHYPRACITLIGLPWARDFVRRFSHLLDGFVAFPGHPAFPEAPFRPDAIPAFLLAARVAARDLAIQMHGSGEHSNAIVQNLGAARTAGFVPPGSPNPDPAYYATWPVNGTEVARLLALTDMLGAPRAGTHLEFPLDADDRAAAAELLGEQGGPGWRRFVVVHPGARFASRRWPLERFAAVARALVDRGWPVVITGSASERALASQLMMMLPRASCLNLAGRTSLGALAALLERSALLVCNDTGVSHVAAALGVNSVVVACGSDPERWSPEDRLRHRVLAHWTPCRPCTYDACPVGHPCAVGLPVQDALDAAASLLSRRRSASARRVASHAPRSRAAREARSGPVQ